MALHVEHVLTEGIAQLSYLVGDDSTGTAAVIDPRPDVEVYVALARKLKLAITHIFETHIHADFVSGARELAGRVGSAKVYVSAEGGAEYGFDHQQLKDGDRFEFGKVILTARFTPGHTPEHMSYLAAEKDKPDQPWGVFTGDSLFVNSAGRPDLLGSDEADQLADELFDTLTQFYLKLGDHVLIHPGHGQGSPCGASIGDRLVSAIGYERRFNPFLQHKKRHDFKRYALETAPPEPTYYKRMKKLNAAGPEVLGRLPVVPGLPAREFKARMDKGGVTVIDTRSMLAFGGGHVPDAINIGARPEASVWAGWMLDPKTPILLVLDEDADLEKVVPLFLRTGYGKFAGYLTGGMKAWDNAGLWLSPPPWTAASPTLSAGRKKAGATSALPTEGRYWFMEPGRSTLLARKLQHQHRRLGMSARSLGNRWRLPVGLRPPLFAAVTHSVQSPGTLSIGASSSRPPTGRLPANDPSAWCSQHGFILSQPDRCWRNGPRRMRHTLLHQVFRVRSGRPGGSTPPCTQGCWSAAARFA